jgi:hypothetical protein
MSEERSERSRVARTAVKRAQRRLERHGVLPADGTGTVEAALIAQTVSSLAFVAIGALVALFSKTFYVVVTDTQVVVLALGAGRSPGKVVVAAPFAEARLSGLRRTSFNDVFELGVRDRAWRLQAGRAYRSEVETLVARLAR